MRRVGIDVGGTFTDLFAVEEAVGEIRTAKVLTVKHHLVEGVDEYVSVEDALNVYGVVIDSKSWQIDDEATARARSRVRQ